MFTLKLYKIKDGENVLNKDLTSSNVESLELQIVLKADTDVITPTILLTQSGDTDYSSYNYASIDVLKRLYFITQVERVNNRMVKLSLKCDVITTYKDDILASNARFLRGIKDGDYVSGDLDVSVKREITTHVSNVTLVEGETDMVLSTLGGVANG